MKNNVRAIALKDISSEIDADGNNIVAAWQLSTKETTRLNRAIGVSFVNQQRDNSKNFKRKSK